ncbi:MULTISPECIES: CvpA family protein [unclassified Jeotgalibaca]|uniref:CvpA family protein n=1 Tax=unclassified Jeotgalibaca TaxID=2621505 RepID=UPI003FD4D3EE
MLTLIILFILFIGIYAGMRRGLILQVVHTVGYVISFFVAKNYYLQLSEHLEMLIPYSQPGIGDEMIYYNTIEKLNLDIAFYNALSFLLIIAVGWLVTRIIGYMLNSLAFIPVLKQVNTLGGGVLGFIMQYIGIFLSLTFLTFIPFDFIQNQLSGSGLANWIIQNTPFLSQTIYDWWIGVIAG